MKSHNRLPATRGTARTALAVGLVTLLLATSIAGAVPVSRADDGGTVNQSLVPSDSDHRLPVQPKLSLTVPDVGVGVSTGITDVSHHLPHVESVGDVVSASQPMRITVPVGVVAGYSRWDDESPLENDTRHALYHVVSDSPGQHVSQLADALDVSASTVRYHGRVLEEENLVEWVSLRGRNRLYPVDTDAFRHNLAAALNDEATARVLRGIDRAEPLHVTTLAADIDRSPSTVSYHLSWLEDANLVQTTDEGRTVVVRLDPRARASLGGE